MDTLLLNKARERGIRIKQARLMAGFRSARAFCQQHPCVALSTLKAWESGKHYSLTPKGAYLLVEALKKHGINTSMEWLIDGKGHAPRPLCPTSKNNHQLDNKSHLQLNELLQSRDRFIKQEVKNFSESHPQAVAYQVPNQHLQPHFREGDWLCGFWLPRSDFSCMIDQFALLECQNGNLFYRQILGVAQHKIRWKAVGYYEPHVAVVKRLATITRTYRCIKPSLD